MTHLINDSLRSLSPRLRSAALKIAACLLLTIIAWGQSSSGVISGRVTDSSGLAVVQSTVTLENTRTRDARSVETAGNGEFLFTSVQPGTYSLLVKAAGFKNLEKTGLSLSSSERLSAGTLRLEIGSVTESIEVKADVTPVQIASSERSALLDSYQVTNLMTRGRDIMGLLVVLPGVVNDSTGGNSLGTFGSPDSISGTRGNYNGMNLDGISGNTRSGDNMETPINIDAIAEVKVLTSNYQAEYGKAAGAVINVVSKGGTQEFHGLGYYYVRNDAFNANNFFSNRQGLKRPRYRYNTLGSNIGGPIYIPGKFNTDKQQLFFFFSQEYLPNLVPNGPRNYTVPTLLERGGDFSQSRLTSAAGTPIVVVDPLNKNAAGQAIQFPGNIVPANRIDRNMQKLLNIFPAPNTLGPNRAYNFQVQDTLEQPRHQESLRIDYNISSNLRAFVRGTKFATHNKGPASTVNRLPWMKEAVVDYATTGPNVGGTLSWIISPTLVNETVFGYARWTEDQSYDQAWLPLVQRDKIGVTLGQLYPKQNPLNFIPSVDVGSQISNRAQIQWEGRFPMHNIADTWSFTDNVSKSWNNHLFKVGVQYEHVHYLFTQSGTSDVYTGKFDFSPNNNNSITNTGYGYSNALMGYFNAYDESTNRSQYSPVTPILEWYAQDSWKVKPRLTLDLGLRFTAGLQQYSANNLASAFVRARYDPAKAPLLYRPGFDSANKRAAIDPRNGAVLAPVYIGQIVPGTGDLKNGLVVAGEPNYPRALVDFQGILLAPRLGFAWDVFGNGKTAIRGGVALNNNPRNGPGFTGDTSTNPPLVYVPRQNYGTTVDYLTATGTFSPPGVNSLDRSNRVVRVYMTSLSIQRNIGFDTVVDVGYVGSFGRHLGQTTAINNLPYGARFLASSLDPTQPGLPLTDNFLRPYPGFAGIELRTFEANSSYHSLQVQAQHRLSRGVHFGLAYTWSKAMDYTDNDKSAVTTQVSRREFNYGPATYDRTHVFAMNYLWEIPKTGLNNGFLKQVLDGWQINGITRYVSGPPLRMAILGAGNLLNAVDITGGGDGWRAAMSGNPVVPGDQRTVEKWFDTSVFSAPANAVPTNSAGIQSILARGNTPIGFAKGPGIGNWDVAIYKTFPLHEKVKLQFRAEAYNAFNHTQFSAVNVTPTWNLTTGAQTNAQFGQVTSARDPRIMQFAVRLSF
jgi:hypothetical protein